MAIAYDNSTDLGFSAGTTLTAAFTTGTGSERYLLVGILTFDVLDLVTGVTYNGVAMTRLAASPSDVADGEWSYIYGLAAPATGANNVVVTKSLAGGGTVAAAIAYTGCSPVSQPDNSANPTALTGQTSITATLTTNADNCWLVGFFRTGTNMSAGANTTLRANAGGSPTCLFVDSNAAKTPPGSYSLITTFASSFAKYIVISLQPPIIASTVRNFRSLLGVGI